MRMETLGNMRAVSPRRRRNRMRWTGMFIALGLTLCLGLTALGQPAGNAVTLPPCETPGQVVTADLSTGAIGSPGDADGIWNVDGGDAYLTNKTGNWVAAPSGTRWIQPVQDSEPSFGAGTGTFTYAAPISFDPSLYSSIQITGKFSSDNETTAIRLDTSTFSPPVACDDECFEKLHNLPTINVAAFQNQMNHTFEMDVRNDEDVTGLLVNATLEATCQGPPDLAIEKSASGNFEPGGTAEFTITITNNGPGAASGPIEVSDSLPTGVQFQSVQPSNWNCNPGPPLTCNPPSTLLPLQPGDSTSFTITVGLGDNFSGPTRNCASVAFGQIAGAPPPEDPNPGNNQSCVSIGDDGTGNGGDLPALPICEVGESQTARMAGEADNFDPDGDSPSADPSNDLENWVKSNTNFTTIAGLDGQSSNQPFIHSFTGLPTGGITQAQLVVGVRKLPAQTGTDNFNLSPDPSPGNQWSWQLWDNVSSPHTLVLNLDQMPQPNAGNDITASGNISLLSDISGSLHLYIQDDTSVDFARLALCSQDIQPPGDGDDEGLCQFDANNNGVIDNPEILDAIDAWINGDIPDSLLFDAIDAWVSGDVVCGSAAASLISSSDLQPQAAVAGDRAIFVAQGVISTRLTVDIFGLDGKHVVSQTNAGNRLSWNLRTSTGRPIANGVYLYQMTVRDARGHVVRTDLRKLMIMR